MGDDGRDEELAVVNLDHVKRISETFRPNTVKKNGSIQKSVVQEIWKNRLAPRFYLALMNVMFPGDAKEVSFLSFYTIYKNLAEPEAEIVFRALTIYHIATIHEPPFNYEQADEYPNAPLMNIKAYVCDVITSYLHSIIHINMKEPLGWLELKASNSIMEGNLVAAYLLKDLESHRNEVSIGSLEIWLEKSEIYYTVSVELYLYLFGVNKTIDVKSLVPSPIVQTGKNSRTLMSLPDVLLLNSKLPKRAPRWTLAFMLDSRTGDWEKFKQAIYGKGQTLIVIQDSNGDIFGMYGSQQWVPSSGFYGNDQSFLFTLKPDVNVYESSGRNNNFQIFTDTGIGMGGNEDNFGLFINYGAETGLTSLSCSTFRQFWPLARELDFTIVQIEIWIVSEDPIAAPVEVVELGEHGDQEKSIDLRSENLDVTKLKNDFFKNDLLNKSKSMMMKKQGSDRKMIPSGSRHFLERKRSKMGIKPSNNDDEVEEIVEQMTSETTSVVQEALQKQSERCEDEMLTKVATPGSSGDNMTSEISHVHIFKRMPSERKLSKMELKPAKKEDKELEEIVEDTRSQETSAIQEVQMKQSGQDENGVLTNVTTTPGLNRQKSEDDLTGRMPHEGCCIRKSSRDFLRPRTDDMSNFNVQRGELTRQDGYVHPSEGESLGRGKPRKPYNVATAAAAGHDDFIHPSLRPKDETIFESPKQVSPQPIASNNKSKQEITSSRTNNRSADGKSDDISDSFFNHPIYNRKRNSLVDFQVQVGECKLMPLTCRASRKNCARASLRKNCACNVKSACYCKSAKPLKTAISGVKPDEVLINPIAYLPSSQPPPMSHRSNSHLSLKNEHFNDIQQPIQQIYKSYTRSKPNISNNIENMEKTQYKIDENENIMKGTTVTEPKLLPGTTGSPTVTSQVKIDLRPCTDVLESDSLSMIGCRCSSSTESSSVWEGDGKTLEQKLKSECCCQEKTSLLNDLDGENKLTCYDHSMISKPSGGSDSMSKPKDVSSSMCSCVLGPKDQGVRTASEEKQSTLKDTQQLTRSSKKSTMSMGSEGASSKLNISSNKPYGFLRSSDNKSQESLSCNNRHAKSFRKSSSFVESEGRTAMPTIKYTPLPCSSSEKQLGQSLEAGECLSSSITDKSLLSCNTRFSKHSRKSNACRYFVTKNLSSSSYGEQLRSADMTKEFQPPSANETLNHSKKYSKISDPSSESCASARFCTPVPPTCLTCRSLVKLNGCQCKTRLKTKLNPIIEQEELLQQRRISSELTTNSKSELTLINVRKTDSSAVPIGTEDSSTTNSRMITDKDNSKKTYESSSTLIKSVKKTCLCSLPRSCFPQFPEDQIQTDEDVKKCGCGTHAGTDVIRFPTLFPEIAVEENSQTANFNYVSSEASDRTVSQRALGTDGPKKGKRTKGQGTCPCEDEDGTIIILNVSKCNTMQALEKIVQELDVKCFPDLPNRLTKPEFDSARPKSCVAPDEAETDRIQLLLKSKMKGPPKDLSETKIPKPRE